MVKTASQREVAGISYTLTYKAVKNLNLRVHMDGTLTVSAPRRVGVREVDRFVAARSQWIESARARLRERGQEKPCGPPSPPPDDRQCLDAFMPIVEQWREVLGEKISFMPQVRIRDMKSCWGVCHPKKQYITLNSRLLSKPPQAIEYVVLHELVHFLYPDHQEGFHAMMKRLMPDYKQRKAMLRG